MIYWQNTKNPKLKGKATSKTHFDRLNTLANNSLKIIEGVSKEAAKVAKGAASDAKKSAKDAEDKK